LSKYRIYVAGIAKPFEVEGDDKDVSFEGTMLEFAHFGNLSIRNAAVVAVEKAV